MKLALVALLGLASLNLARASEYLTENSRPTEYVGTDLSIEEEKIAENLVEYYEELDKALREKLPDNADPEANITAAKEILSKKSLSMRGLRKKAYKFFVFLETTVGGKCDLESYKILARNYEAIRGRDQHFAKRKRVEDVLRHYQLQHAKECGPRYRQMYKNLIGSMDTDDLERLTHFFSGLEISDFGHAMFGAETALETTSLASIPTIRWDNYNSAIHKIGMKVKRYPDSKKLKKPSKKFHHYLLEPCKTYRNLLNAVLSPARFDAKTNADFIEDDWEFTDAMFYNRICGSLLDEKEKSLIF